MGTLNSTLGKQEIRRTSSSGDFFTNPLVDKVLAVMACIPVVYPVIRYYHSLELTFPASLGYLTSLSFSAQCSSEERLCG